MNVIRKRCPACNKENEDNAAICINCGVWLEGVSTEFVGISDPSVNDLNAQIESFIDLEWIPENGVGIQVAGETIPIYVPLRKDLVIGRTTEFTSPTDDFLDLSHLNAGALGVSRRHVMIRRIDSGYEVVDLTSSNGSWINDRRLVPNIPYTFPSGSQLRMGNMRLLIMYHPVPSK
jgi:hypothetical protein